MKNKYEFAAAFGDIDPELTEKAFDYTGEKNASQSKRRAVRMIIVAAAVLIAVSAGIAVLGATGKMWFHKEEVTDAYSFPEYAAEEPMDWNRVRDYYQVPEDEIKAMSTEGVIETCLDYPIFGISMVTSNTSIYAGFRETLDSFIGFKELFSRPDAGRKMLEFYESIDFENVVDSSDTVFSLRVRYLEYIMAEEEILTQLTSEERSRLKAVCVENLADRVNKYSDRLPVDSLLLLTARLSYTDDPGFKAYVGEHPLLYGFLKDGWLLDFTEADLQDLLDALGVRQSEK